MARTVRDARAVALPLTDDDVSAVELVLSETLGELDSESCAVRDLELLLLLDGERETVFVSDVLAAPEKEDARDGLTLGLPEPDTVTLVLTLTDAVPESVAHAEVV